ncbi:MAG: glycosyltransferase [Scytolyngbya sp. HA4215-MV1]|nr:glycosyltransferase [Scytolyngbya sp. HA4215-MV1]
MPDKLIHFVWLLPEPKDSNKHIRRMIQSEAAFVDEKIIFLQAEDYHLKVGKVEQPDLIIFYGSFYKPHFDPYCLISKIRQTWQTTYLSAWLTDDPYEFDSGYLLTGYLDFLFINDKNASRYYHSAKVHPLPLAAAMNLIDDRPPLAPEWDFVFCGVGFANRVEALTGLQSTLKQYSTLIIGSGWTEELKSSCFWLPSVPYEELLTIYQKSKIVLNFARNFDFCNTLYEIVSSTTAPRTFEVAALGIFQLVFFDKPEVYEYFSRDELITFSSKDEFDQLVKKYLSNAELRTEIAQKAQKRVLNQHLYRHRFQTLLTRVFSS